MNKYKAYILIDPTTNIPRYVGITSRALEKRFSDHLQDIKSRPKLNLHKTNWFLLLKKENKAPIIKQIAEFDSLEKAKQFEINYISKYKEKYKLINQTKGGDFPGFNINSREVILAKDTTRPISQYNILGEHIADYEITEDAKRALGLKNKACSHITQCCRGKRSCAYGYIWRYKEDSLGDISFINPKTLLFNKLVQYDLEGNKIKEFKSYKEASLEIGDHSHGANIEAVIYGLQKECKGFKWKLEPKYVYYNQELLNKIMNRKHSEYKNSKHNYSNYKIYKYDINMQLVKTYNSILSASEDLIEQGVVGNRDIIKRSCKNGTLYQGFYWRMAT